MATYTAAQLSGSGVLLNDVIDNILGKTFAMNNPSSGSSYFTFETVRNNNGTYAGITPIVSGELTVDYIPGVNVDVQNIVSSSYVWSVSVNPGGIGNILFKPDTSIAIETAFLRATGDISLEIL